MVCVKSFDRPARRRFANALACTSALLLLSLYCHRALPQQHDVGPTVTEPRNGVLRIAALEQAFWACDHAATTRGVHTTPVALCSVVIEELKNEKFGGDFEPLLKWWQQHKVAEHQKLLDGTQ
jgi:hypothetical protein